MDQRWTSIRALFREASELEPDDWDGFLRRACPEDAALREEVLAMLRSQHEADDFLEAPLASIEQEPAGDGASLAGRRIGPYEVLRVIARGGMGVVYEARDIRLDKTVALKTMHPLLARDPVVRKRFEQEARTLARLEDPHVVRVYALHDEGDDTFIVMEYVQGPTLAHYLQRRGTLNARETLFLARQLLVALGKAHRLGIVHRDLKPANVMLARDDDGRPLVKVLDFGIAKQLGGQGQTLTHGTIGTLLYMAPEQVRGNRSIDARADLYALGVMLYEMLTGRLPYDRKVDEFSLRQQIVEGTVAPPHRLVEGLPEGLSRIVVRALAKVPDDRFASAEDMLHALHAFEAAQRMPAPAPPPPQRPRWYGAAGAMAVLAAIAFLSIRFLAPDSPSSSHTVSADSQSVALPTNETGSIASRPDTSVGDEERPSESPQNREGPAATPPAEQAVNPPPANDPIDRQPATARADTASVATPPRDSTQPTTLSTYRDTVPDTVLNTNPDTVTPALPAPAMATLDVSVSPGGDLYLGDSLVQAGVVIDRLSVPAGTETIRIVNDDRAAEWACRQSMTTDATITVAVDFLTPIYAIIAASDAASGDPITGATIYIDGQATDNLTPQAVELQAGVHRISVRHDAYRQLELVLDDAGGCYQQLGPDTVNFDHSVGIARPRIVARLEGVN